MDQQNEPSSIFEMEMDGNTQGHMITVSTWGRTISVIAFVCISLFVLSLMIRFENVPVFTFSFLSSGSVVILVVALAFMILWMYFLFRASRLLREGIFNRDNAAIADGFRSLKIFFVFSLLGSVVSIISTLLTLVDL